jgi:hypothetical protein
MLYAQFVIVFFGLVLTVNQEYRLNQPIYPGGLYYFHYQPAARNPIQPTHRIHPWQAFRRGNYYKACFEERGLVSWVETWEGNQMVCRVYYYYREGGRLFRRLSVRPDGTIWRREELTLRSGWPN